MNANMPSAIYVWLVQSEQVLEQPGSWRIRKWDTEPFPEANFTLPHSCTEAVNEAAIRLDEAKKCMEACDLYRHASDYGPPIMSRIDMHKLSLALGDRKAEAHSSPHVQLAIGGYSVGVFKDGELIATDKEVCARPDAAMRQSATSGE